MMNERIEMGNVRRLLSLEDASFSFALATNPITMRWLCLFHNVRDFNYLFHEQENRILVAVGSASSWSWVMSLDEHLVLIESCL